MAAVLRLVLLVPAGYLAAVIGAAFVLVYAPYDAGPVPPEALPWIEGFAFLGVALVAVGSFSVGPALVAIVLAEVFRLRGIAFWLAVGGAIGLAGALYPAPQGVDPDALHLTQYAAAGFVGGFLYWLVAGRWSGQGLAGRGLSGSGSGPA